MTILTKVIYSTSGQITAPETDTWALLLGMTITLLSAYTELLTTLISEKAIYQQFRDINIKQADILKL